MRVLALAVLAGGCAAAPGGGSNDDPPLGPCDSDDLRIDVQPTEGQFGDIDQPGAPLWCGSPPQGGAPYSPFGVRFEAPEVFTDGVAIHMTATDDADGSTLASTDVNLGLACANVGESAGLWVGSQAHLRYEGWNLDELDGRSATLTFTVTAMSDDTVSVERTFDVVLTLDQG